MQDNFRTPKHKDVVRDLQTLRSKGLGAVRRVNLPALHHATLAAGLTTVEAQGPAAIEALLRKAVDHLGGGTFQEAAALSFGLAAGTKLLSAPDRRRQAAKVFSVTSDTYRKTHEKTLISEVAEGVLALCHDQTMRVVHLQMEQRHPADSRLAVAWVERFEAYYRLWTPIYALGADLKAALQIYASEPSDHVPWDPESEATWDPVKEAQGYARSALYRYACFQLELKRFIRSNGGLWLLSATEHEEQVSEAVMRIGWHNSLNEEDDSWLRRKLADCRHEEAEQFYRALESSSDGDRVHAKWQQLVVEGHEEATAGRGDDSQVQNTIAACATYCDVVERDWMAIADWYAPGAHPPRTPDPVDLYQTYTANRNYK